MKRLLCAVAAAGAIALAPFLLGRRLREGRGILVSAITEDRREHEAHEAERLALQHEARVAVFA